MKVDEVLQNLDGVLTELYYQKKYYAQPKIPCTRVSQKLGIFDWFPEKLTISRLEDMQRFLREAKKLGFNGYCCFKVGGEGTASGKWAYKKDSIDGYSPKNCECLYESFYSTNQNYWKFSFDTDFFYPNGDDWNSIRKLKDIESLYYKLHSSPKTKYLGSWQENGVTKTLIVEAVTVQEAEAKLKNILWDRKVNVHELTITMQEIIPNNIDGNIKQIMY